MIKQFPCMLSTIMLIGFFSIPLSVQVEKGTETLVEGLMDTKIFKSCGLQKLTKEELQNLDNWLTNALLVAFQAGKSEATVVIPGQPRLETIGGLEQARIIKDFNGMRVIIERANGEQWLLEAKIWCNWSWLYERRRILLKFDYVVSKLINDNGDVCEFWTKEQIR